MHITQTSAGNKTRINVHSQVRIEKRKIGYQVVRKSSGLDHVGSWFRLRADQARSKAQEQIDKDNARRCWSSTFDAEHSDLLLV